TRLELVAADVDALGPLLAGEVRQADADLGVGPHDQAGTVEGIRASGTPDVGVAAHGQCPAQRLRADRVRGRDADVGVAAGLVKDLHGLLEHRAVQDVDLGLRLAPLAGHLLGEQFGPLGLLLGALPRPLGSGHALGYRADLVAVLLLYYLHERGPADQRLRRARGKQLQRSGQATVHVALRRKLAHGELPGPEPGKVLRVGLRCDLGLGTRLFELDPQPVVLLVQAVDLVGQLPRPRHQILQGGCGLSGCGAPDAAGKHQAEQRGGADHGNGPPPGPAGPAVSIAWTTWQVLAGTQVLHPVSFPQRTAARAGLWALQPGRDQRGCGTAR